MHELHEVEMRNALRRKRHQNDISDTQLAASLSLLASDLAEGGRLIRSELDWQLVYAEAERLSERITAQTGIRTLDLIHVAAALGQTASVLVSGDRKQCEAAHAAGLQVMYPAERSASLEYRPFKG